MSSEEKQSQASKLPISKNEDVEFASERADEDDLEAVMRAKEADRRQEQG